MAVIDIKLNPTKRDLRIFALMFVAFFGLLGLIALGRREALLIMAAVTGAAFLISIAFNRDQPRTMQLLGVLIPLTLLTIGGIEGLGVDQWTVAGVAWGVGVVGAILTLASPLIGKTLYTGWMYAALPLGWTMSHLILGIVFYLVVTPIGLVMRVFGHDPMQRRIDREAVTYWTTHETTADPSRYFRQY